ncbi:MAG: DNA-3-methyladenine glycosylase I [Actinomycetota bacterium]
MPDRAPAQVKVKGLADYLEVLTKAVFQAGISWRVIESKWDGFREAFHGFDVERVAGLGAKDIDKLAADTRIVRNRKKIEATVENARTMLELDVEHGGFRKYLRSFGGFEELVADLRKHFRWLGDMGAYYWLYVVGEQVPSHDEWMARQAKSSTRKRAGARSRG